MKLNTLLLTAATLAMLAACGGPSTDGAKPETPAAGEIAAPTPESGPAAPNSSDTLSNTPVEPAPAVVPPAALPPTATPAPTPASATPTAKPTGATKAELAAGAGAYTRICAMCHGPSGEGTSMGATLATAKDVAKIKEKVSKGMVAPGDKMPPMAASLSAEDLDAVAKYVAAGLPAQ